MTTKKEAAEAVRAAKARRKVTWALLAEAIDRLLAWTTAALLGQHPMTADQADAAVALLDLGDDVREALQLQPTRGALDAPVPTDPTIYGSTRSFRSTAPRSRNSSTKSSATAS